MMDVLIESNKLKALIQKRIEEENLSYRNIELMAKNDGISVAKSNISAYMKNRQVGRISQKGLIWLALKLGIDIRITFTEVQTEKDRERLNEKLNKFIANEAKNRSDSAGNGSGEAEQG